MSNLIEINLAGTDKYWAFHPRIDGGTITSQPRGEKSSESVFHFWVVGPDKNQVAFGVRNQKVDGSYFMVQNTGPELILGSSIVNPTPKKIVDENPGNIFEYIEDKNSYYFRLKNNYGFVQKNRNEEGNLQLVQDEEFASFWYLNVKMDE